MIAEGEPVAFLVIDFANGEMDCRVTEDVPPGFQPTYHDGSPSAIECFWAGLVDTQEVDCVITNSEGPAVAGIRVSKVFTDQGQNQAAATVELDCTAGEANSTQETLSHNSEFDFEIVNFENAQLNCEIRETVTPQGYTPTYDDGTLSATKCDWTDITHGQFLNCDITNTKDPGKVTITVTKTYTDTNQDLVEVQLDCNSGLIQPSQTADVGPGVDAVFMVSVFDNGELDCRVTESVPAGYNPSYDDGTPSGIECSWSGLHLGESVSCNILNRAGPGRALIEVMKEFSDDNTTPVMVELDCNSGLIDDQNANIGHGETVTFIVVGFPSGELDCRVTEILPAGYAASFDDGTLSGVRCEWVDLEHGDLVSCLIFNDGDLGGDADDDGTPTNSDQCPGTQDTILFDPATGCSFDQLCPCAGPWKNNGEYVSCINKTAKSLEKMGLISKSDRKALTKDAKASSCGK